MSCDVLELSLKKELYEKVSYEIEILKKNSDIALEYASYGFKPIEKIAEFVMARLFKRIEKEIYKDNNNLIEIKNNYCNNKIDDWEFVYSYKKAFGNLEQNILFYIDWFKENFEKLTFSCNIMPVKKLLNKFEKLVTEILKSNISFQENSDSKNDKEMTI